jgi:hypothetical protein
MKTARIHVEIVKETKKAKLLRGADGRQGWIQARWLADNGTVSAQTYERACSHQEQRTAEVEAARAWDEAYHALTVVRETEKAVAIAVEIDLVNMERTVSRLAWFPKSVLRDGAAPGWMIRNKINDLMGESPLGEFPCGAAPMLRAVGCPDYAF